MRFETMLEHQKTIAKAATMIEDLSSQMSEGADPLAINQVVRWVNTKEDHATQTQHIIAQYFMTQRIKPDMPDYAKKLQAAHAVMIAAMKCKQSADPSAAQTLHKAILSFHGAYAGKDVKSGR
jgi:nickel superoxide dismutase